MAEKILRDGPEGKASTRVWGGSIDAYCDRKLKAGKFRPGTVGRVKSTLRVFAAQSECKTPEDVKLSHLEDYYNSRRMKSEAGARSTLATIQAFLADVGLLRERVEFDPGSKPERCEVVVYREDSERWIVAAPRDDLKFVLYCGFHAGMRAGEIRYSRPPWFDLRRGVLTIPAKELQTTPNGKRVLCEIKDRESRSIPLTPDFREFLRTFLADCRGHCLVSKLKSDDGLYDFRRPFWNLAKKMGRPEVSPHAMRHSWITELCNSGNHSMQEVAAWSGDTLETIERHYWHKKVEPGALDATFAGKRKGAEILEKLDKILAAGVGDRDGRLRELKAREVAWQHGVGAELTREEQIELAGLLYLSSIERSKG